MYAILMFFSFLESIICFALMSSAVMLLRQPIKKRITAAVIVMISAMSIFFGALFTLGIDAVDGFTIVIILIVFSSWFLICSGDTFFVSTFSLLTFINIYVSISYIGDKLTIFYSGVPYMVNYIIIRTVIYGSIIPFLFKFVRPHFRRLVEVLDNEWRVATLVPLIFLILQVFLLYYPVPYWYWESNNWYKFITFTAYILFLVVYYVLYIQSDAIVEKYMLEKRELLIAQQNKLWESELARQKTSVALASQQRHDMRHHNAVIVGMLQSGDVEGLKDYMRSFEVALDAHSANAFCTNPIVNSLLNIYSKRAMEACIKTTYRVSVPESIDIDNVDLTCVFGNALENALEGCLRLQKDEQKEIIVTAKFIDYRLRIQVENTCRDDITFDGELPVTQKQGGGTGTKSILYTAERYDGTAGFSVSDGKFIAQIVLNAN